MKELSKDQKLEIIDAVLEDFKRREHEWFICNTMCSILVTKKLIDNIQFSERNFTDVALEAIPELLQIKPADIALRCGNGWFGGISESNSYGKRTAALEQLRKIIENASPEAVRWENNKKIK
jgi:hypothetical protein